MTDSSKNSFLVKDLTIIALSIVVAFLLIKGEFLSTILDSTSGLRFLGSFVAGMFFTSVFTTAPAMVTLGEISTHNSIPLTALFGALGAVVGDLLIFRFIRDRLSGHLLELIQHDNYWKRFKALFRLRYFRWFTFLAGGLIIASPLPDELGIGLLGFSKMKTPLFICISFAFNFVGIVLIGLVANAL